MTYSKLARYPLKLLSTICLVLFLLSGCKATWDYYSGLGYDNVREDGDFKADAGDFERLRFLDRSNLFAMCWYNDSELRHGKNIQVLLKIREDAGFSLLTNNVTVVSSKQGPLELVSASVSEIDFRKDLNHLSKDQSMDAIRNDTLTVAVNGKTYRFASRLRTK